VLRSTAHSSYRRSPPIPNAGQNSVMYAFLAKAILL